MRVKLDALVNAAFERFKATTNSDHNLPVAESVLAQNFSTTGPNQKQAGDITYL